MVNTVRLFLVPMIGAFTLLIPFFGIPIYILIIISWYTRNQDDVNAFFRGHSYRKKEYSVDTLEKLT
jgi:hypothetical protein